MTVRRLALALFVLLVSAGPAAAAETRAFVVTSDFSSGELRRIDLDTHGVLAGAASVYSDARARWFGGLVYVVNRLGQDNLQVIDPATLATLHQFTTGSASNPSDVVLTSPTRAYISRYGSPDLLVMDPTTGATLNTIPLGFLADADGIPEMDHMILVGHRLFVSLQRLARPSFAVTDTSLIAVIDTDADTVVDADPTVPGTQGIVLAGRNPVTAFGFDRATSRLLIGCVGNFLANDGGIEWIDPIALKRGGVAITEAALGGDIGALAWNDAAHSYAIVSDASFDTHLVSWSANSGTRLATLFTPGGFSLPDCALNDRGELYVCDSRSDATGVFVWRAGVDTLIAGPLDTDFPPQQIAFDATSASIAATPPPAIAPLALSAPWPNPARTGARFTLTLDRAATVRVEAYDLSGRRVRVLEAGSRPAGSHEVAWDLRDQGGRMLAPGLYMVRADVGSRSFSRKIVLGR